MFFLNILCGRQGRTFTMATKAPMWMDLRAFSQVSWPHWFLKSDWKRELIAPLPV